jgi:hypothetical protein
MNPGSAQQLVSAERRVVGARLRSFELGGGEFTQTLLDAQRALSGSRGHLFHALRSCAGARWGWMLQIATITRVKPPLTSQGLH